ncbi:MAG: gamma carbonic anhydrase family protein [Chloroflexi bacterium]|nr:gamma carbonic anhydrase family protein [Chloroflexota bacterium]
MIRSLNGKTPLIHETAFVSESAYVIGDVVIGQGSSVWPGVVVRGDSSRITIGSFTSIQDNSVLHTDNGAVIGDYVTIGHRVMCHATRVGDGSLLGNGSVLNEGVELGEQCLVAAGAVVIEGMKVTSRKIVAGVPARERGDVEERHLQLMKWANDSYIARTKQYKAEGGLESARP